jgi:hypothetical protein
MDRPGFVVAGSGESIEGKANYRDHTVRLGDVSPEGLREKARYVLGEMERRLALLGVGGWMRRARSRPIQSMISIPSWQTRLCAGVRHARALPGISPARRSSISNSRWIVAASRRNVPCEPRLPLDEFFHMQ